jgi:hypothetical protein
MLLPIIWLRLTSVFYVMTVNSGCCSSTCCLSPKRKLVGAFSDSTLRVFPPQAVAGGSARASLCSRHWTASQALLPVSL